MDERLDYVSDLRTLSSEEVESRSKSISKLWVLLKAKDSILSKIAKLKWLKEGDANKGFFHAYIKSRCIRNSIIVFKVEDVWVESVVGIRREVVKYSQKGLKRNLRIDLRCIECLLGPSLRKIIRCYPPLSVSRS